MNPMTVVRSMVLAMLNHHALRRICHKPDRLKLPLLNDTSIHTFETCTKTAYATRSHAKGTSQSS